MPTEQLLPPLQRDAVLAMHRSTSGMLVRRERMYAPAGEQAATSGQHAVQEFTKRLVLMLDREGLVHLDDAQFPEHVSLNAYGKRIAERIAAPKQCPQRGCTQTDGKPCAYRACPNRERAS